MGNGYFGFEEIVVLNHKDTLSLKCLYIFFDIEGYPHIEGGLEYLWGNTYFDRSGTKQFKEFWAHDSKEEKKIFLEHIQKKGLRKTAQRELILVVFLETEDHLSSEDLYWLVQKQDSNVGQTTVYRTLKLLTDAGLAREVRLGDGRTYYEHHFDHDHHDHMICTECGEVIENGSALFLGRCFRIGK